MRKMLLLREVSLLQSLSTGWNNPMNNLGPVVPVDRSNESPENLHTTEIPMISK